MILGGSTQPTLLCNLSTGGCIVGISTFPAAHQSGGISNRIWFRAFELKHLSQYLYPVLRHLYTLFLYLEMSHTFSAVSVYSTAASVCDFSLFANVAYTFSDFSLFYCRICMRLFSICNCRIHFRRFQLLLPPHLYATFLYLQLSHTLSAISASSTAASVCPFFIFTKVAYIYSTRHITPSA